MLFALQNLLTQLASSLARSSPRLRLASSYGGVAYICSLGRRSQACMYIYYSYLSVFVCVYMREDVADERSSTSSSSAQRMHLRRDTQGTSASAPVFCAREQLLLHSTERQTLQLATACLLAYSMRLLVCRLQLCPPYKCMCSTSPFFSTVAVSPFAIVLEAQPNMYKQQKHTGR